MNQLSDRLNRLSPSATLAMSQKSNELKAQGVDVINMSVGEPDFNTPDHIKEAAKQAIDDNFSRYSPVPGYPALRNAIVAKLKNENGLDYTAAQISCANGAKQSVCNAIIISTAKRTKHTRCQTILRLKCAGTPAIIVCSSFGDWVTTDPAATRVFPINFTPGRIMDLAPSQHPSPISTLATNPVPAI
jgi:alanine-alpha-ketoisovalerate/valine-pyruvate aminotransferase